MKAIVAYPLAVLGLVLWTAFGLCAGTVIGYEASIWWVMPIWARKYPHDGQLGLGVLAIAGFCGAEGALAALLTGSAAIGFWIWKRRKAKAIALI
jgi:hypothetical protein